jgi:prepilin-type N-terminal cleavage/methylation domain-containing protein
MRRRAFSLAEMLLAMALLSTALVATFSIFDMGQRTFQYTSLRQGLQAEARRISLQVQQDIRLSHMGTVSPRARSLNLVIPGWESQGAQPYERDALCMAGVRDWSQPASVDAVTGFPNYNCFLLYYATSAPEGQLIRQVLVPPSVGTIPHTTYALNDNPALNPHAVGPARILSRQVLSLKINSTATLGLVEFNLRLRSRGGMRPGTSKRTDETYQVLLKVKPENTYPKL